MTKSNKQISRWVGIGTIVLVVVLAGIATLYRSTKPPQTATKTPSDYLPKASPKLTASPTPSPSASATPTPTISAAPGAGSSTDGKVKITSPAQGDTVTDGTVVKGTANVASGILYYRLKGGKGGQLANGQTAVTPNQEASYSFTIGLTNQVSPDGDQGELEVYTIDGNGTAISIASVAVNIRG